MKNAPENTTELCIFADPRSGPMCLDAKSARKVKSSLMKNISWPALLKTFIFLYPVHPFQGIWKVVLFLFIHVLFALYEGSHRFLPLENHSLCSLDMDYFDNFLFSL